MSDLASVSQHGVMLNVANQGLLITGAAGIGKSSLALALIEDGQQLIADDLIELNQQDNLLIATCPSAAKGLLHHRELGLINIEQLWGKQTVKRTQKVDAVIELVANSKTSIDLQADQTIRLLDVPLPFIQLHVQSPCPLKTRIYTWLKNRPNQAETVAQFKQKQHQMMQQ